MKIEDRDNRFQIVWDLGRRCTYACTYCPPHRNNKTSPIVGFDDLKDSIEFVDDYISMYEEFRDKPYRIKSLSFTGGEPTIHPGFLKFGRYMRDEYGDSYSLNMTTNGVFSMKQAKVYHEIFGGTISYHPEGKPREKQLAIDNIMVLAQKNRDGVKKFKVNVMFHKDYFQECIDLCDLLTKEGIKYIPRRIGDDGYNDKTSIEKGYTHIYNAEQEAYFDSYFGKGSRKGRMCCGGRDFCCDGKEGTTFVPSTNFYGYTCFVNWYFMYINQETRDVYTHQTCAVNLDNDIAPLGTLDESDKIIERLEKSFYIDREMPVITCPKTFCGCGMCIDKSHKQDDFSFSKINLKYNEIKLPQDTQYISIKDRMREIDRI